MILKKPKFWDFKKPSFFAYLLYPLTIFVEINNIISNLIPKKKFTKIKTICVGNLYVGGTGKTPTTLFLYNLLRKMNINPVTAKKFYNNQIDEQIFLKDNSNFISCSDREEIVKKEEGAVSGMPGIASEDDDDAEKDELYDEAVAFVAQSRRASISAVQRKLRIGYNRAARMIETMEETGVLSPMASNGNREVLIPPPPED